MRKKNQLSEKSHDSENIWFQEYIMNTRNQILKEK